MTGRTAPARVLLLAGTAEATALASLLAARPDVEVTASLAGHTTAPARLPCAVRTGGFGGAGGLADALRTGGYRALVDATHPFAAVMPRNAAAAAGLAGVPRVRLLRPPWRREAGDTWHEVDDLKGAAAALGVLGAQRVLLTVGRLDLAAFASVPKVTFVVRSIEAPEPMPLDPASTTVVLARGPFGLDDEVALLRRHDVDTLVTKNSGAAATAAKLTAARAVGATVVMVRRPPTPLGPLVTTPEAAVRWLDAHVLAS